MQLIDMKSDWKGFRAELKKYMKGLPELEQYIFLQCGNLFVTLWQDTEPFSCDLQAHN